MHILKLFWIIDVTMINYLKCICKKYIIFKKATGNIISEYANDMPLYMIIKYIRNNKLSNQQKSDRLLQS